MIALELPTANTIANLAIPERALYEPITKTTDLKRLNQQILELLDNANSRSIEISLNSPTVGITPSKHTIWIHLERSAGQLIVTISSHKHSHLKGAGPTYLLVTDPDSDLAALFKTTKQICRVQDARELAIFVCEISTALKGKT